MWTTKSFNCSQKPNLTLVIFITLLSTVAHNAEAKSSLSLNLFAPTLEENWSFSQLSSFRYRKDLDSLSMLAILGEIAHRWVENWQWRAGRETERTNDWMALLNGESNRLKSYLQGWTVVLSGNAGSDAAPVKPRHNKEINKAAWRENERFTEQQEEQSKSPSSPSSENGKVAWQTEEVMITGSRLSKGSEVSASPIIVLSRSRLQELGVTNVGDAFKYLPQQSFLNNEQSSFGGSRVIQLRGLAVGTTLVLINGRRTVTSALTGARNYFDVNSIPMSAIDRIEVLSDSASAVYGADAMGGVVNVVLKKDVDGRAFELFYGAAEDGAAERRGSLTLGGSAGNFAGTLVLDVFSRDFLYASSRERAANADYRLLGGSDKRSVFANPGNVSSLTSANLPGLPSRTAAVPSGSAGRILAQEDFLATAGMTNLETLGRFSSLVPKAERLSGAAHARIGITNSLSAFGELLFADREDERITLPTPINAVVPATNPFNPFGVPVGVTYILTGIGPQRDFATATSLRSTLGLEGAFRRWDWELSVLNTRETGRSWTIGRVNIDAVRNRLADPNPSTSLNLFQDGPGGSMEYLAQFASPPIINRYSSSALQGAGFIRGKLINLPAGEAEFVGGFEARKEDIHFESRPSIIIDPDRKTSAAYAELRLPVLSSKMDVPLADSLILTAAGRYDDYNDAGGTFNPQIGIVWELNKSLLLRASYGSSFRAPSLFELYQPSSTTLNNLADPRRGGEIVPVTIETGGNPDLKPEEATSISAGFVISPSKVPLRVGATYWRIRQERRVLRTTTGILLGNEDVFQERVIREDPTPADIAEGLPGRLMRINATSLNFGELKTSGIDFELNYSSEFAFGQISPTLLITWVDEFAAADLPNVPPVERVGVASVQGTVPEWKAVMMLTWGWSYWGASATARYISSYEDANSLDIPTGRKVAQSITTDLQLSFDFNKGKAEVGRGLLKNTIIRIGAVNIFDDEPSYSDVGPGFDASQGDLRRRFIYASVSKSF